MNAKKRVVILDDYEQALRKLADWSAIDAAADVVVHHQKIRGEALAAAIADADAIVLMRDRTTFDAALLARLPKLRYLVFTGTRNAGLDAAALAARAIPVSHTDWGPSKDSTCELAWALILAAAKHLERNMKLVREGRWRDGGQLPGVLAGDRIGLIGLGEIGGRVARMGVAMGMQAVAWSPHMTPERAAEKGATSVTLEDLLSTSRVVSLHIVPSPATRKIINAERLALMRPDAILCNTSRSALVDMAAIAPALAAGRPGFAAIDVFDEEPLPADFELRSLPNVVLTPHMGFVSEPVYRMFAKGVTECLLAWLQDKPLVRVLKDK